MRRPLTPDPYWTKVQYTALRLLTRKSLKESEKWRVTRIRGGGTSEEGQVPPKSAKVRQRTDQPGFRLRRISLGLRRIRPKPCGGFGIQVSDFRQGRVTGKESWEDISGGL
jgi:hypothetical protein